MPYHKHGEYDAFDSLAEAKAHYKRCRKEQFFVLSDQGIAKDNPVCSVCGNRLSQPPRGQRPTPGYTGNRCDYLPLVKKFRCMHYLCAWSGLLEQIARMRS